MTLQEAITILKRDITFDFAGYEFDDLATEEHAEAIATILNAVVKGELKHE